jgi:hypothetical protein
LDGVTWFIEKEIEQEIVTAQKRKGKRFQVQRFTVSIKELAEWFGLEVARLVVDECLPQAQSYDTKS